MKKYYALLLLTLVNLVSWAQCSYTLTPIIDAISCYGECDGKIDLYTLGGTSPYTFNWNIGIGNSPIAQGLCAGTYSATVTDGTFCETTITVPITQPEELIINSVITNSDCSGNNATINLSASGGNSPYLYLWSNGKTSKEITGLSTGVYNVNVLDNNSCEALLSYSVTSVPKLRLSYSKTNDICGLLGTIKFKADSGTSPYSFIFNGATITENEINDLTSGNYILEVYDVNNCYDSLHISILEEPCTNPVPDIAFTPNGDGINDGWYIAHTNQYPNLYLEVYDRWGQKVFFTEGSNYVTWTGTRNGSSAELPEGTYYYVLYKEKNNKDAGVINGSVAIVR